MKSARVSRYSGRKGGWGSRSGVTFIELLIALAIFSIILAFGFLVSLNSYRQLILNAERDNAVAIFRRARAKALSNMNESAHGVFVSGDAYTIFQGDSYGARAPAFDEVFPAAVPVSTSTFSEVVFSPLAGDASASGSVSITDGIRTAIISFNYEGRITW